MFGFKKRVRETGFPTSSNRASSLHLSWRLPPGTDSLTSVSATLVIVEPPQVESLYFWALQASFADRGKRFGAGHLGLQWYPAHPGNTAVNWGGYGAGGGELQGGASALPSATGNVNTRDFAWRAGEPYVLRIDQGNDGWRGSVNGVVVRELFADGAELVDVVMWSEVFARCDAPSVAVQWSDLRGERADGSSVEPLAVVTNYQAVADGGCSNTNSSAIAPGCFEQRTNTPRTTPLGAFLNVE